MPPSHRSSSSHSSSHHSSSSHRSSSSHSSGSSYRSSGPSHRSTSSHSSVSRSYSTGIPYRTRTNQPRGFSQATGGNKSIITHHCRTHDYVFYPMAWVDPETNRSYKSGYYDESGNYYKNLALKKDDSYETQFQCEYCGSMVKTDWKEGAAPSCPNCGAVLAIADIARDEEVAVGNSYNQSSYTSDTYGPIRSLISGPYRMIGWFLAIMVVGSVLSSFTSAMGGRNESNDYYESNYDYDYDYDYDSDYYEEDEIYVDVLGRYCYFYDEYDSYYDEDTDCYFYYNNYVSPGVWQYWYEGISSNYGDYGWMEYEEDDDCWYIEKSQNNWVKLPDRYLDDDRLWHMEE